MNVTITGRHVELKENDKQYAQDKFEHASRFSSQIQGIEVIFKEEDRKIHCEAIIRVKRSSPIVIDVASDDYRQSIDMAVGKCERQLRRLKEKKESKRMRRGDTREIPAMNVEE